jgi:BlaI family penicillinase repressor
MAKSEPLPLTKLELQIMQVIWREGAGTVTQVQEALDQQLAYTTVQTMLNILHRKGKPPARPRQDRRAHPPS